MEKLIELLNEYEETLNTGLHWRIDEKYGMLWRGLNLIGVDQYLISKHYGFIKWLVENDKIDISKLGKKSDMGFGDKYTREESLLMLLAISKNPIKELISYLK